MTTSLTDPPQSNNKIFREVSRRPTSRQLNSSLFFAAQSIYSQNETLVEKEGHLCELLSFFHYSSLLFTYLRLISAYPYQLSSQVDDAKCSDETDNVLIQITSLCTDRSPFTCRMPEPIEWQRCR